MSLLDLPNPEWREPSEVDPPFGGIVVVGARVDDWEERLERTVVEVVSDKARRRAERFEFEADARRHLMGRLVVRCVAGDLLDRPAEALRFRTGPHGKLELFDAPLAFNLTHGGAFVLAAFAEEGPVGIDVEPRTRTDGGEGLARSVLTDEEYACWREQPVEERAAWFMHVWTVKEAFIKATGEGLARDPTAVACCLEGGRVVGIAELGASDSELAPRRPEDWRIHSFGVSTEALASLVWREHKERGGREVAFVRFGVERFGVGRDCGGE